MKHACQHEHYKRLPLLRLSLSLVVPHQVYKLLTVCTRSSAQHSTMLALISLLLSSGGSSGCHGNSPQGASRHAPNLLRPGPLL